MGAGTVGQGHQIVSGTSARGAVAVGPINPGCNADGRTGRTNARRMPAEQLLGAGAIGEVYRGVHEASGQTVAIKVIYPGMRTREAGSL